MLKTHGLEHPALLKIPKKLIDTRQSFQCITYKMKR